MYSYRTFGDEVLIVVLWSNGRAARTPRGPRVNTVPAG